MKPVPLFFGSVLTRNYLGYGRALAASIREHHPDARIFYLIVDADESVEGGAADRETLFERIPLSALPDAALLKDLRFIYSPFELCNALKPFLHRYLLECTDAERWVYLDTDILVLEPLDRLFAALDDASIMLHPHIRRPITRSTAEAREPAEDLFLRFGVYNGGFLGVRRTDVSREFLSWWRDQLCWNSLDSSPWLYVDQLWLNLVPVIFREVKVLHCAGINIAYWNLHEETLLNVGDGHYTFGGTPVLFAHFSTWRFDEPERLTTYRTEVSPQTQASWRELGLRFHQALVDGGHPHARTVEYGFANFRDGTPIPPDARREYLDLARHDRPRPADPFAAPGFFRIRRHRHQLRRLPPVRALAAAYHRLRPVLPKRRSRS